MSRIDMYQQVTDTLIELLETAGTDWLKPWHAGASFRSVEGRPYRGVNVMLLGLAAAKHGFSSPVWGVYNAWARNGGQVRKGEHGTRVIYWHWTETRELNETGEEIVHRFASLRDHVVFNADQQDGATLPAMPTSDGIDAFEAAETLLQASGATIRHGGDQAYYSPAHDVIVLPQKTSFKGTRTTSATEAYYGTAFHELTHWTGHEKRCNRQLRNRFGDEAYAFEELIAELGAAYITAAIRLSIEPRADHAQYINSWLRVLKGDKRAVFTAASKAQAACDFVLDNESVALDEAA